MGRRRQFTRAEIQNMKERYLQRDRPLSASQVGKLFRTSAGTVLRAAAGTLKAKD
jgi:hypothetical protein